MHLSLVSTYVALLTITNPIGNIPIFLRLTRSFSTMERRRTAAVVGVAVFAVLAIALVAGRPILMLFDIDVAAFRLAGYCVLVFIAWSMLTANPSSFLGDRVGGADDPNVHDTEFAIVPLAIPVLAGPGAISLVISFASTHPGLRDGGVGLLVIALVAATVTALFFAAPVVGRVLGKTGMDILTRIFGLLLLSIAIGGSIRIVQQAFPGIGRG